MRESLWNKKMPTLLGVLLITVGVLATSYLVNIGIIVFSGASPSDAPQNVRITNITDSSLTVTYTTPTAVIGTVSIGKTKDTFQTILDDRDEQSGIPKEYRVHSITVKNLQPNSMYIFSITSASTTYLHNNSFFQTQTGPKLSQAPSSQTPLSGKLQGPQGVNPSEALVFVTTPHGQTLSTLVKSNGIFIIPLNLFRSTDLQHAINFSPTTALQILATNALDTAQATTLISDTNPLPTLTLGNTYDFTTSNIPVASSTASLGFPGFNQDTTLSASPEITTPSKDEAFSDQQPQFSGTALPNEKVTVEIHSDQTLSATVTSSPNGTWTYRPSLPLSPGSHTISITSKNSSGILQTVEQSFIVYAQGSQVDQSATPSGQKATPTPTPTPTPRISAAPTLVIQPTRIVSVAPSKRPQLPPTGSNMVSTVGVMGLVISGIGVVLYVVSLGAL